MAASLISLFLSKDPRDVHFSSIAASAVNSVRQINGTMAYSRLVMAIITERFRQQRQRQIRIVRYRRVRPLLLEAREYCRPVTVCMRRSFWRSLRSRQNVILIKKLTRSGGSSTFNVKFHQSFSPASPASIRYMRYIICDCRGHCIQVLVAFIYHLQIQRASPTIRERFNTSLYCRYMWHCQIKMQLLTPVSSTTNCSLDFMVFPNTKPSDLAG